MSERSGESVEIWTDHNPLVFIERMKGSNQRILRWALQLQEFTLILLVAFIVGVISAAPQGLAPTATKTPTVPIVPVRPFIPILVDTREGPDASGAYRFNFEAGNGIRREEGGVPKGPDGAVVSQGAWSFTFPDGTPALFRFVADENGYRVVSDFIPTPPPLPPHALAQIEKARLEDAAAKAAPSAAAAAAEVEGFVSE
ncbi:endocuticle structural glycoprotein SgAbd-9-like [Macrobrachium nipponense]|uniref:endocuticle structural glycoprotein SgAbd-9-like n=1 Tax=Macrobrachium nipponense TaxID=159736 RepID=UPI0030C892BA